VCKPGERALVKATPLHAYKEPPRIDDLPEPEVTGPFDMRQGKVRIEARRYPLGEVADVMREFEAGRIMGRAVLIPDGARP